MVFVNAQLIGLLKAVDIVGIWQFAGKPGTAGRFHKRNDGAKQVKPYLALFSKLLI